MKSIFLSIAKNTKTDNSAVTVLPVKKLPSIHDTIKKWKLTGDKLAQQAIIKYLKPTIDSALKTYASGQLDSLRIPATKLALLSMRSFDTTKKAAPSTYAFINLQRLNRMRRDRENMIHIPLSKVYMRNLLDRSVLKFIDLHDREPSYLLLADLTHISKKNILKVFSDNAVVNDSATLDLSEKNSSQSFKDVTDNDYIDYVYSSIAPIDQKILLWSTGRYGKQYSNNEIAAKLKLSPGAVSQRKAKIQTMLQNVRGLL